MSSKKRSAGLLPEDVEHMQTALQAAQLGAGHTSPNPAVGAVLVHNGSVLAVGHHAQAGGDHAEIAALAQVGAQAKGATLYSTLEPCNHQGRTGPCTEAIIKAGITRVVVGTLDPNPQVAGGGVRRLKRGRVEVVTGVLEAQCRDLNEAYNFAIVHRRPYVVLKMAMSLDGRIATRTGQSQWITSDAARTRGRALRGALDGILVGAQTAVTDDPLLTARIPGAADPVRVVMDSQLRISARSQLVQTARTTPTVVVTTRAATAKRRDKLEALGVTVLVVKKTRQGHVDPRAALAALYGQGLNSILLEGGASLAGAFADARLINKVVAFIAPVMIGGQTAPGALGGRGPARLEDALRLTSPVYEMVGPDMMVTGYPQ